MNEAVNAEQSMDRRMRWVVFDWYSRNQLDDLPYTTEDIVIVWFCKTLKNYKALIINMRTVGKMYHEVTYNGEADEFYHDVYKKSVNETIRDGGITNE